MKKKESKTMRETLAEEAQKVESNRQKQKALASVAAGMSATNTVNLPLITKNDAAKPFLEPYIHVLETVTYLKLKHPIDAWDFATYTTDNANCPKVELVQFYGALCFRIGKRILPFENAIEFVVKTDKQGSLR